MSGAQWSPERLDGLASVLYERGFETAAHALRDFARVVSVLGHVGTTANVLQFFPPWGDMEKNGVDVTLFAEKGQTANAPNALAAILALADALAGEPT